MEGTHGQPDRAVVGRAPALVAMQVRRATGIATPPDQIRNHVGQGRCVQQTEIHALPSQRVNGVRGITDQRHAVIDAI